MNATLDLDGIPTHALRVWAANGELFVAIPHVKGGHYITRYPFTTHGLCLVLDLLGQHRKDTEYVAHDMAIKPVDQQAAIADLMLKRMGVI